MKKITFLLLACLVSTFSFAQTPMITMISDGDCTGGNPKVVELYANGTIDFSQYSLEIQTNANTTWDNTFNLAALGTITDDFAYIHTDDPSFATEYPNAVNSLATTSSVVNFNGDDRIRLVQDSNGSVIDQYGAEGVDGTGEAWEYKDGYAKRNNGTLPNGTFSVTDWSYYNGALDGQGVCQGGTVPFEDIIVIASYTPTGGGEPSLVITSPSDGTIFSPNTTSVSISFTVANFDLSTSATSGDGDGYVQYSTDGTTFTDQFTTSDIVLNSLTTGDYSVIVQLVDNNGDPLATPISDNVAFSIPAIVQIADITALRADVATNGVGSYYEITGESIFTHADAFNNRKWFQDQTVSGIMVFDPNGVIENDAYAVGDHVTGLIGHTEEFNGVLQLIPSEDLGVVVSNSQASPQVVNISDFNTNWEDYESELIAFENVSITEADGTVVFETGTNYTVTNGTENTVMRTEFFDADYIGTIIPQNVMTALVGVASEFNGTAQIFVRNSADIDAELSVAQNNISDFSIYPNPVTNGFVSIETTLAGSVQVEIYNLLGKQVISAQPTNGTLNLSSLQSGVYLIKITQNGNSATKKLIIN